MREWLGCSSEVRLPLVHAKRVGCHQPRVTQASWFHLGFLATNCIEWQNLNINNRFHQC